MGNMQLYKDLFSYLLALRRGLPREEGVEVGKWWIGFASDELLGRIDGTLHIAWTRVKSRAQKLLLKSVMSGKQISTICKFVKYLA